MSEWKTFDEMPGNPDCDVFVTDFKEVYIENWVAAELYSGFAKSNFRWDYIEYPDMPDRHEKPHRCQLGDLYCYETSGQPGYLVIRVCGKPCSSFEKCNFCPVCGYSISEDEDDRQSRL